MFELDELLMSKCEYAEKAGVLDEIQKCAKQFPCEGCWVKDQADENSKPQPKE